MNTEQATDESNGAFLITLLGAFKSWFRPQIPLGTTVLL